MQPIEQRAAGRDAPEPRTEPGVPVAPLRRFERLGLCCNPFCVQTETELLGALTSDDIWARARAWIDEDTHVIEFVGQRGWGKSTHMRVVQSVAHERQLSHLWTYVQLDERTLDWPDPLPNVWFIDEVDRLTTSERRRIWTLAARGKCRVVLGTHVSMVGECDQQSARCRSVALAAADESAIARFLDVRMHAARSRSASAVKAPRLAPEAAQALRKRSSGSLREVEALLYEVFQSYAYAGAVPATIAEADIERAAEIVQRTTRTTPGTRDD